MRRRIVPRLLALGILVLALAGCVRFQANVTLTPQNTVNGEIIVAVILADDTTDSRTSAQAGATQIAEGLLGTLTKASGVSTSDYEQDGYLGTRIKLTNVALTAFDGQEPDALKFSRDGDEYVFSGAIDFTSQTAGSGAGDKADDSNLTVSVTFPGAVTKHNGDLSGTTVTWKTPIEKRLEMAARGGATAPGIGILGFVVIGIVVVVLAAAVVGVLLLLRSRRMKGATVSAPPPPPVVTDAVLPVPAQPETPAKAETTAKAAKATKPAKPTD